MRKKLLLLIVFLFARADGVLQNHYVLGTNGLNSAVRPECGTVISNLYKNYQATSLKNQRGEDMDVETPATFNTNLLFLSCYPGMYLPPISGSAASYGFQIMLPFNSLGFDNTFYLETLDTGRGMNLGDVYVEPVNITWRSCYYNLFFSYGLYFPTGNFHPYSLKNSGLGCFGNLFSFATTVFLDQYKTLTASAFIAYEKHGKMRGLNYYPGDNLTIDWGVGKTIYDYVTLGMVGYAEWQISYDHGSEVPFLLKTVKDRVYAIGPEVGVAIPYFGLDFKFRFEWEFGAHARPQGNAYIGDLALDLFF